MALRKLNPVTPGQRHKIAGTFETVTTGNTPEKSLLRPMKSTGGRNSAGKMTMRYIGGGHKRKYRVIDFKREKDGVPARVDSIQYDPNRTARIALLVYADGEKRYMLAPNGLQVGQTVLSGIEIAPEIGNALPLYTKYLLVLSFTILSYIPDREALWPGLPEHMHSSPRVKDDTPSLSLSLIHI